ncbi:MAG: hypothetical protein IPQ09_12455 [Myxococcales bacterium]|nr:hypothetical protein [Myxococcales bacterium]HQY61763.1 hypothetical protein [Polyangiaceae bacterium]
MARRRMSRSAVLCTSFALALGACAPAEVAPPPKLAAPEVTPPPPVSAPPPAPPPTPDPFAVKGPFRGAPIAAAPATDVSSVVADEERGHGRWRGVIPAAPASCRPYLAKAAPKTNIVCDKLAPSAVGAKDGAASLLVDALSQDDPLKRDAALREAGACKGVSPAEIAALRALLAPPECGDAIVAPLLARPAEVATLDRGLAHTLAGLWIAGKLARAVGALPPVRPPFSKESLLKFTRGPLRDWFTAQGAAIEDLAKIGVKLEGHGRALVAVEAGIADMRFVDRVREVPMPPEWKKDPEISGVYQQSLDQAMEPRKQRGRDAALVGLADAAALGIVQDARIGRARDVLSKLFGGSRVDALDGLMLPPAPTATPAPSSPSAWAEPLVAKLPLPFGERILAGVVSQDDSWLLASCQPGLRASTRRLMATPKAGLSPVVLERVVRGRVELGRAYFRGVELDQVLELASREPARFESPEMRLYLALALALRFGPDDAAAMMHAPSPAALELRHTEALDQLAAGTGPYAGEAAFDAAWLRQLSPPEGVTAAWFTDVSARFRDAKSKLRAPEAKARAAERADVAEAIAKTLR